MSRKARTEWIAMGIQSTRGAMYFFQSRSGWCLSLALEPVQYPKHTTTHNTNWVQYTSSSKIHLKLSHTTAHYDNLQEWKGERLLPKKPQSWGAWWCTDRICTCSRCTQGVIKQQQQLLLCIDGFLAKIKLKKDDLGLGFSPLLDLPLLPLA